MLDKNMYSVKNYICLVGVIQGKTPIISMLTVSVDLQS